MKLRILSFVMIIVAMLGSEISLASGVGKILIDNTVPGYIDIVSALVWNAVLIINLITYKKQIENDVANAVIDNINEALKTTLKTTMEEKKDEVIL